MRYKARFQDRQPPRLCYSDTLQNGCGFIPQRKRLQWWKIVIDIVWLGVLITAIAVVFFSTLRGFLHP